MGEPTMPQRYWYRLIQNFMACAEFPNALNSFVELVEDSPLRKYVEKIAYGRAV